MRWGHQFLTEVKKEIDFAIFRLGLSNFRIGAWFPFAVFQFTPQCGAQEGTCFSCALKQQDRAGMWLGRVLLD